MLPSSYPTVSTDMRISPSQGDPTCSGAVPPLSSLAPDDLRGLVMAASRVCWVVTGRVACGRAVGSGGFQVAIRYTARKG